MKTLTRIPYLRSFGWISSSILRHCLQAQLLTFSVAPIRPSTAMFVTFSAYFQRYAFLVCEIECRRFSHRRHWFRVMFCHQNWISANRNRARFGPRNFRPHHLDRRCCCDGRIFSYDFLKISDDVRTVCECPRMLTLYTLLSDAPFSNVLSRPRHRCWFSKNIATMDCERSYPVYWSVPKSFAIRTNT